MTPILRTLPFALALGLAACSIPPQQYLWDAPASTLRVTPVVSSMEVRTVSLPLHATSAGIVRQSAESGALISDPDKVWADDPERAATLMLARTLAQITNARVIAEPWPFSQLSAATLSVTVEDFLALNSNTVRLRGFYAVAIYQGASDRTGQFDIQVPIEDATPEALGRAHGAALTRLAEIIAERLAR